MSGYWPVNVFVLLVGAVNFLGLIFCFCYLFECENNPMLEKALRTLSAIRDLVQVPDRLIVSHGTLSFITVYSGLYSALMPRKAMVLRKAFWMMDKVPAGYAIAAYAPLQLFYPAPVKATIPLIFSSA